MHGPLTSSSVVSDENRSPDVPSLQSRMVRVQNDDLITLFILSEFKPIVTFYCYSNTIVG